MSFRRFEGTEVLMLSLPKEIRYLPRDIAHQHTCSTPLSIILPNLPLGRVPALVRLLADWHQMEASNENVNTHVVTAQPHVSVPGVANGEAPHLSTKRIFSILGR